MILDDIYRVIMERKKLPRPDSYVSGLIAKGTDEMCKKLGEEAIEVIVASKAEDRRMLIHELADLWFHSLVLMAEKEIRPSDIFLELESRAQNQRRDV